MISVIIPSYNRAETIRRSVDSVLNQSYRDIEVIVVDDCSTDGTLDVISGYTDNRLRCVKHKQNRGACAARNTGIEYARGEYIAFQDSDDSWRPDKLRYQLELLQKQEADICFCKMERHGYPADKARFYPELSEGVVTYEVLLSRSYVSTQTILARREMCDIHKFDILIKRMQDYDWIIRAAHNAKVCFANEVLVDVYLQRNSITTFEIDKIRKCNEVLLKKYPDLCRQYPAFHVRLLSKIAYYKELQNENALPEYREILAVQGSMKTHVKYFLSKLGLLSRYYQIRDNSLLGIGCVGGGGVFR